MLKCVPFPYLRYDFVRVCRVFACLLCLASLLAVVLPSWGQSVGLKTGDAVIAHDIASAGFFRMQAQRLAKLYLQGRPGLNISAMTDPIEPAVMQADVALKRLERYGKRPVSQHIHGRCESVWQEMRVAVQKPYSPTAVERINQLAEELTIHAGKLVMQIELEAETPVGRLLDLSSRLNMLAQRLARIYLLVHGGDRSQGLLVDLAQTRQEFATGMRELEMAPENSVASREALNLAKVQWVFFDNAVQESGFRRAENKLALHVASSSERIMESLEVVSAQYVRDLSGSSRQFR